MTAPAIELSRLVDERLGRPFLRGARGPDAYYCLGLWLDLVEAAAGIKLPDPFIRPEEEALRGFWGRFIRLSSAGDLRPLDILFWRSGQDAHVATVENATWAVSTSPLAGVFRTPLDEVLRRTEGIYRLKELL